MKKELSNEVQELWAKLDAKWESDAKIGFYNLYIVKIQEILSRFEVDCSEFDQLSCQCINELDTIKQSLLIY